MRETENGTESFPKGICICENGTSDWRIVYPFGSNTDKETATELHDRILKQYGADLPVRGDAAIRDQVRTHEILIGKTNREATRTVLERTPELCFSVAMEEDSLVILGRSPRITAFGAGWFFDNGTAATTDGALYVSPELDLTESYLISLSRGRVQTYLTGSNASYDRPTTDVTAELPELSARETGVTLGQAVTVDRTDPHSGGGQYLAKLYTEGLSRAPRGDEFAAGCARISRDGCVPDTLLDLAKAVFLGEEYRSLGLDDRQVAFTAYRAVLSRDPTESEIGAFDGDVEKLLETLCRSDEMASLMGGIVRGPYFWGANNSERYSGNGVWTQAELEKKMKPDSVLEIPEGTLVVLTGRLTVPDGCVIRTQGSPIHYAKMARFLRAPGQDKFDLVVLGYDSRLESVFVDGNFSSFDRSRYGAGINLMMTGNGNTVHGCRVSDSVSHGTVMICACTEHQVVSNCLITGYANDHDSTWADGISCLGADCLLEYNDLVDMTDGIIAVFRYINLKAPGVYIRSQNTITRYNRLVAAGNSAYAGYDNETVNWSEVGPDYVPDVVNEDPANMTGCVAYGNEFYTSAHAHIHLLCTLSTMPWRTNKGCDRAFGGTFADNYTPEGCFVNCGVGIGVDKVTDVFVRGNRLSLRLGEWCAQGHVSHAYAVDTADSAGDLQPGFEDCGISVYIRNLIGGLTLEAADRYAVRQAWVWEDPVVIPVSRFECAEEVLARK